MKPGRKEFCAIRNALFHCGRERAKGRAGIRAVFQHIEGSSSRDGIPVRTFERALLYLGVQ
jgi:hypothetical protein